MCQIEDRAVVAPTRRLEDVSNLVRPARCAANVLPHLLIFTEGYRQHFVTLDVFGQPVDHWFFFFLFREGTE